MRAYVLAHETHQSSLQIRHHFYGGHALMYEREVLESRTRPLLITENKDHHVHALICDSSLEPALKNTGCVISLSRLSVLCTDIGGMSQVSDYSRILVLPTSDNIVTHRQQRNCSRQHKMETWLT